jgi:hypothetical protein
MLYFDEKEVIINRCDQIAIDSYGPSQKICNIESAEVFSNETPEEDASQETWVARHRS